MFSKFFIPDVGFRLRLVKDEKLMILNEYRNEAVILADPVRRAARGEFKTYAERMAWQKQKTEVKFSAGTLLSVDRVYIRKGASDFSSLTFNILESPQKIYELKSKGGYWSSTSKRRFFLHLEDVNNLEFEPA